MKKELTQDNYKLMIEIRNEWLKKIEKPNDLTIEKVKPHIEWLYEFCGLKKPEIIIADSPVHCQVLADEIDLGNNGRLLGNQIRNQINHQVRDPIDDEIDKQVNHQAKEQVGQQVWDQIWDKFRLINYLIHFKKCTYGDVESLGLVAYYDYFKRIGVVNNMDFDKYMEYSNQGIFYSIQLEDVNIVCGNPEYIDRDPATGELHSEDRMAIRWKDGWGLYFLRGVEFEEDLWKQVMAKTCDLKTILSIQNTEQRMAALSLEGNRLKMLNEMYEIDRQSMKQRNSQLEEKDVEYILYLLPKERNIFDENNYFVFTTCPSTGRQHLEGVAPQVGVKGDVLECVASQFQISKEEFLRIGQHS